MPDLIRTKINRRYKDLDLDMIVHPMTADISARYDDAAINGSLMNIIKTKKGERAFNPTFGSNIYSYLFEPLEPIVKIDLKDEIVSVLANQEPRIVLHSVLVEINDNLDGYDITISYAPINENRIVNLEFFLNRLR